MTPDNWSDVWNGSNSIVNYSYEKILWRSYLKLLSHTKFPKKSKMLELGCGLGRFSCRIAEKYGLEPTLVDYSKKSLEEAKKRFVRRCIKAEFLFGDILDLNLNGKFDLVTSEGLIEHFVGEYRERIFFEHVKRLKNDGYLLIFVPMKSRKYDAFVKFMIKIKRWGIKEIPFKEEEIDGYFRKYDLEVIKKVKPFLGVWLGVLARKKY